MAVRESAAVTLRLFRIAAWPLVLKVPVLAAGLMITGAAAISQVVFWQFAEDQRSALQVLTSAYLDGLSASVLPGLIRRDVWEVYEALDRSRGRYPGIEPRFAIVALLDGRVLAASDPQRFPFQSAVPDELLERLGGDDGLRVDTEAG